MLARLLRIELIEDGDELMFRFVGDGFLYNMVRILVGTLLEVGRGLRSPDDIPIIIEQKERQYAGKTAHAHGLIFMESIY